MIAMCSRCTLEEALCSWFPLLGCTVCLVETHCATCTSNSEADLQWIGKNLFISSTCYRLVKKSRPPPPPTSRFTRALRRVSTIPSDRKSLFEQLSLQPPKQDIVKYHIGQGVLHFCVTKITVGVLTFSTADSVTLQLHVPIVLMKMNKK